MPLPAELRAQVRRLEPEELRQLLLLARGLLVHADGHPADGEDPHLPAVRYRQEHRRCGREGCSGCPHGPYWYAYWWEDGRRRRTYIGRHLPGEPLEPVVPDLPAGPGAPSRSTGRPAPGH